MSNKILNKIIVGSGLSSLVFAEEFLKKNSKLHMISPEFNNKKIKGDKKLNIDYKSYCRRK